MSIEFCYSTDCNMKTNQGEASFLLIGLWSAISALKWVTNYVKERSVSLRVSVESTWRKWNSQWRLLEQPWVFTLLKHQDVLNLSHYSDYSYSVQSIRWRNSIIVHWSKFSLSHSKHIGFRAALLIDVQFVNKKQLSNRSLWIHGLNYQRQYYTEYYNEKEKVQCSLCQL